MYGHQAPVLDVCWNKVLTSTSVVYTSLESPMLNYLLSITFFRRTLGQLRAWYLCGDAECRPEHISSQAGQTMLPGSLTFRPVKVDRLLRMTLPLSVFVRWRHHREP